MTSYAWYILRVTNNDMQQIKLVPSNPKNSIGLFSDAERQNKKEGEIDFYFDGQLVPKTEWADALSIDPTEIKNIDIHDAKSKSNKDGRHKIYIMTE